MKFTISILYGSVRTNRSGIRAAYFLKNQIENRGYKVHFIDPIEFSLPLIDKMYKEYEPGNAPENMQKLANFFEESDGFIIVSGEYNHSIPPALKNILDHFQSEYLYKPSALVTYSAGAYAGVRVAVHLRAITGELGMSSIPSMLSIPKVSINFTESGTTDNPKIIQSTAKFLNEFEWYLEALKTQRLKNIT